MKYLLIEDDPSKCEAICQFIQERDQQADIVFSDHLSEARRFLLTRRFDLIVFDVFIPDQKGGKARDASIDLISDFTNSPNAQCESIAITSYVEAGLAQSTLFNFNGITIVTYSSVLLNWQDSLGMKIQKIRNERRLDFVIFCALNKERMAYRDTAAEIGELKRIGGLDCEEMQIGVYRGVCVKPTRMGLVNMAIAATKAIELFRPVVVAMSGICAGVHGESNFLDIVVGDVCWEYQTGKFKDGEFRQEPYQTAINRALRIDLEQLSQKKGFLEQIKAGLFESELKESRILFGPISSGSAVVADTKKMREIGLQHRKWSALEMEMYSMYEAASSSLVEPWFFGAKAVVDMGDASKGDQFHSSACLVSARFVVEALRVALPNILQVKANQVL